MILKRINSLKNMSVPITNGFLKDYFWSLSTSDETYLSGNFDMDTLLEFKKFLKPNQVVYDLGANEGYYSISASKIVGKFGKVFAFEPMPENLIHLNRHVNKNKIENITVINKAVADKNGKVTFSMTDDRAGNTYISSSPKFDESKSNFLVETVTVDHFCLVEHNLPPDLIKIDVEGAEYDVLKGAEEVIKTFRPVVILATHEYHVKGIKDLCLNYFENQGYQYYKLNNHNSNELADFVFYPNK